MIYCICRGSTRGKDLCHGRAVMNTICWFHSMSHQHERPALLSPVCCWSGCNATNVVWESGDIKAIVRAFDVHWMCFYGSWPGFFSTVEVWVCLGYYWQARLLALTSNFISFMHSRPWLSLVLSPGVYPHPSCSLGPGLPGHGPRQAGPTLEPTSQASLFPTPGRHPMPGTWSALVPPITLLLSGVVGQGQAARICPDGPHGQPWPTEATGLVVPW